MTNTKLQQVVQPPIQTAAKKNTGFVVTEEKKEINWFHTGLLTITPGLAILGMILGVRPTFETVILTIIMYFWTGLGITAGYHRMWSHRAYDAHWIIRLILCVGGAAAYEGSAKWWCRNHRAHHRYTDTSKDPYNAKKGFWYSHLGWMLVKQNINKIGYADISDLNRDKMIVFQHNHYLPIALTFGIFLPTALAASWGDFWGGFFYGCMLRMVFVHHATFFVNSLAHSFGNKTFSDHHTAFDSVVTAVLTLGEGYHNYHHEFPQDYRNGIKIYHYDPTKWVIKALNIFGLTSNLKTITEEEVQKARVQMFQRAIDKEAARYKDLPEISLDEFDLRVQSGEALVILEGIIYDVKNFVDEHPGGRQTLLNYVGSDVTDLFLGENGNHVHSKEARNYLPLMRVGVLTGHHH